MIEIYYISCVISHEIIILININQMGAYEFDSKKYVI